MLTHLETLNIKIWKRDNYNKVPGGHLARDRGEGSSLGRMGLQTMYVLNGVLQTIDHLAS